eukprot:SAG22_NODE_246_length_13948_cov_12.055744_17_plen_164_part_00
MGCGGSTVAMVVPSSAITDMSQQELIAELQAAKAQIAALKKAHPAELDGAAHGGGGGAAAAAAAKKKRGATIPVASAPTPAKEWPPPPTAQQPPAAGDGTATGGESESLDPDLEFLSAAPGAFEACTLWAGMVPNELANELSLGALFSSAYGSEVVSGESTAV